MKKYLITVGLTTQDMKTTYSEDRFLSKLSEIKSKSIDGMSISFQYGIWEGILEQSAVIEIIDFDGISEKVINDYAKTLKKHFNQKAVILQIEIVNNTKLI